MKISVGAVLIKMAKCICVWSGVDGSVGTRGQSSLSFMQLTFVSGPNLPRVLLGQVSDFRGDKL